MRRLLSAFVGLSILLFAAASAAAQGYGGYGGYGGGFGGAPAASGGFGGAPAAGGGGGVDCQGPVMSLMSERDKAGKALQAANKRKADVKTACGLLRNYTGVEGRLMKFLQANKVPCAVPDQFMKQLADAHSKSSEMTAKVCQAAANGAAMAPPPSAGLSDALGVNTVGSGGSDKPSAVFDTLHGNILAQ
jgi:hypothetical protein